MKLIVESLPGTAPKEKPHVIEAMRQRILAAFDGQAPRVLDPFAGGGSLPLEAARLGCETYAQDLNPNAVLTLLGTVDYPMRFAKTQFPLPPRTEDTFEATHEPERTGTLVQAVAEWGAWVLEQVRPQLAPFYPDAAGNKVVAYFWAKTIHCTNPACGAEIPLVAHRWLSKREGKAPVAYRLVPQPDRTLQVEILTGEAATADKPATGTIASGSVQCPFCPQTVSPAKVKEQFIAGQGGRIMLAVAFKKSGADGTFYREVTHQDLGAYEAATKALARAVDAHDDPFFPIVPDEVFPEKGRSIDPGRYGVRTWGEMHNCRQLLALTTFVSCIRKFHVEIRDQGASDQMARAVGLYLAFAFSRTVLKLSESSRWDNGTCQ